MTKTEVFDAIRDAARYRPIVPFLGAGISISAGFPTIRFVIQYLAKVEFAIQCGVFEDRFPNIITDHQSALETYRRHPSKYLEDFGWPNLGQLNADIWEWLQREADKNGNGVGRRKIWDKSVKKLPDVQTKDHKCSCNTHEPNSAYKREFLDLLAYDVCFDVCDEKIKEKIKSIPEVISTTLKKIKPLDLRDHQQAIVQYILRKELAEREGGSNPALLKEWLQWKHNYHYYVQSSFEFHVGNLCKFSVGLTKEERQALCDSINIIFEGKITPPFTPESIGIAKDLLADAIVSQYPTASDKLETFLNDIKAKMGSNYPLKTYKNQGIEPETNLLYGDWELLLDRLCEGNSNLADALFTSFEEGLKPTISHRYLAFLQPKLGIPLLLTTNFDTLLERAFQQEGIPPKVFDIHKDAELPNPTLISQQLSLLKLHGSAYGLRLGERLKYTLEADARNNALGYIPKDALMLVMGFNGSERRIMQMLQAFVQVRETHTLSKHRLIWIQGPSDPGPLFNELVADSNGSVRRFNVSHIDTFVQELYFYLTCNSYQSSSVGYSIIPSRPLTSELKTPHENNTMDQKDKRSPVHVCLADFKNNEKRPSSSWASLAGMAFVNSLDNGYTVIWIDIENHHTVEGIIAEIFNRVRVLDPLAPSCAITNMDTDCDAAISKVIERIFDVFKRGRYVLVLDMVESFGRPQMVHHGIATSYEKNCKHIKNLARFIMKLLCIESSLGSLKFQVGNLCKFSVDLIKEERQALCDGINTIFENKIMPQLTPDNIGPARDSLVGAIENHYPSALEKFGRFLNDIEAKMGDNNPLKTYKNSASPIANRYWDSYVVVTADLPRLRHSRETDTPPKTYKLVHRLLHWLHHISDQNTHVHIHCQENSSYEKLISENYPDKSPSSRLSIHWQCNNEKTEERSLQRIKDVLYLLDAFRWKSEDVNSKIIQLRKPGVTEAFVCLLSVFRRPRSLPLLRSFVERWGLRQIEGLAPVEEKDAMPTHQAVHELLQLIATRSSDKEKNVSIGVVSQNHEGGIVWLFREVYEATYNALTEHIHSREWEETWKAEKNRDFPKVQPSSSAAIMDGILHITWHLFAARAYYVDVFLATHDIRAFWEYLYHRVSAIRTITLLITIIKKGEKEIIWKGLEEYCEKIIHTENENIYKNIKNSEQINFAWLVSVLGIFDPIKQDIGDNKGFTNADGFMHNLIVLRQNSLSTLLMAIKKNKLLFRNDAAPDSVLAWSRQFRNYEIAKMREVNGYTSEDSKFEKKLIELDREFDQLEYYALRSKMDYKSIFGAYAPAEMGASLEDTFNNDINLFNNSVDNEPDSNKIAVSKKQLKKLFNIAQCLVETCDERAQRTADSILNTLIAIKNKHRNNQSWVKREMLIAYDLSCRSRFSKWTFWQPLLERENSNSRKKLKDSESTELTILEDIEQLSIRYENLLRETTETNDDDAKHRSTALAIRARALYLQGYFPQAHHYLDLASTGLFTQRIDHGALNSVAYIVRAELLAISAHEHYFSFCEPDEVLVRMRELLKAQNIEALKKNELSGDANNPAEEENPNTQDDIRVLKDLPEKCKKFVELAKELQPIAAASLKKIERAEQELSHAEKLLCGMAHQNIWLIHMEFGWAQVRIERMLFEVELLFLSQQPLTVTEYLKKSGELEQTILDVMQRLRNVLDIIPYQSNTWDEMEEKEADQCKAGRSMFAIECNTLKLWRQLFVAGAYYSSLLNCLYSHSHLDAATATVFYVAEQFIPCQLSGLAGAGNNAMKYIEQWKLWCTAMRFGRLGDKDNMDSFNLTGLQTEESLKSVSFRATVINAMLKECGEEEIKKMWDIRRKD